MTHPRTPENKEYHPAGKARRKKGAQPGNQNAHKHGIYSKFILLRDQSALESMAEGGLKDELALARARLKNALERTEAASVEAEKIAWDAASQAWFEMIIKIKVKALEKSAQANEVWETFMEAIREANDRQGVK